MYVYDRDDAINKVDCSSVYVSDSLFSTPENLFDGAFSSKDIQKGSMVEYGVMRRLGKTFTGMNNPYVFTWSDDIPNNTWAFASGCATFYNSDTEEKSNTRMLRYFDEDRFEIYATKDIKKGDELTHTYKSLEWRTVFIPLCSQLGI